MLYCTYMNRGFLPVIVGLAIAVTALITAGGSYGVYKMHQLKVENEQLNVALSENVEADSFEQTDLSIEETATSTEENAKNDFIDTGIENKPEVVVKEKIVYVPKVDNIAIDQAVKNALEERTQETETEKISVSAIEKAEPEVKLEDSIKIEVQYTKQTPFYDTKTYEYINFGSAAYEIALRIHAIGNEILIPKTTTSNSQSIVGFSYSIISDADNSFDGDSSSKISCSLMNDNNCKIPSGEYRDIKVNVYLYPINLGNYGINFEEINYFQSGKLKNYSLNKKTSKITVQGIY